MSYNQMSPTFFFSIIHVSAFQDLHLSNSVYTSFLAKVSYKLQNENQLDAT